MQEERLTTNIIPPLGPLDASILLVGEAPGEEEDGAGVPFIGEAGQLLKRVLRDPTVDLLWSNLLVTNVFSQRPPRNQIDYFFTAKNHNTLTWEGQEHVAVFTKWLAGLDPKPNVIVALGATAMRILTGRKRINKWRGSLLPCTLVEGYKVYPTLHPSGVMRLMNEPKERLQGERKKLAQNALPLLMIDLGRIKEQSEFPEICSPERTYLVDCTYDQLLEYLDELNNQPLVAVDIETLPGESGPILWCIGFSSHPSRAFTVPLLINQKFPWTEQQESELWIRISKLFLNPNVQKVFQGGAYDLSVLGRYYGLRVANGTYEDTMLCHHASYPYIKKGLETLTSIYTWEPYYKDEGKVHHGRRSGDLAEFRYNCKDASVTREILPVVLRNSKELGTHSGYRRTMDIQPSLLSMMIRGVRVNQERKDELAKQFSGIAKREEARMTELTEQDWNLNSSVQMINLLYAQQGLPIQYNRITRKATTDKEALEKLLRKHPNHPVLNCLKVFRKFSKLSSTYTNMEVDEDGRIHTSYGLVSTWRLSSSESPFGNGGNLQNIPIRSDEGKEIRKLFIPDEGMEMGRADLKQAEAMVVAWEAEDLARIELFKRGVNVHWENAKTIFSLPDIPYNSKAKFRDSLTKSEHALKEYYEMGKIIVHACNYGAGPGQVQATLAREGFHFNFAEIRAMLTRYMAANPFIAQRQRHIREEIKATRTIISAFGRKRQFMGRLDDNLYRVCYAFSPQNTVGEILEVAIQRVWERHRYIQPLLNVHDEIVFQCRPEYMGQAKIDITECMNYPLEIKGRTLIIPTDFERGSSWGDMEEF